MERTIAKWMSKKQGDTFIDMITMLDITYTIAVVDKKSYEYWDQCYELKNMFDIDGESYVTRDVYNEKPRGLWTMTDHGRETIVIVKTITIVLVVMKTTGSKEGEFIG
jgi:hypothetical protein